MTGNYLCKEATVLLCDYLKTSVSWSLLAGFLYDNTANG